MKNDKNKLTEGLVPDNDISEKSKFSEKSERAFKIFNNSIKRAENLLNIDLTDCDEKLLISESKKLDCYRAVIVLSISALDAYIKTFLIVEIKNKWHLS